METNSYTATENAARIETKNKNSAICLINFTYKQTPSPNYLYYGPGGEESQQQNLPGLS